MNAVSLVDLSKIQISPQLLNLLSMETMKKYAVVPLDLHNDRLTVAMADPMNKETRQLIQNMAGYDLEPVRSSREEIIRFLDQTHPHGKSIRCKELDLQKFDSEVPIIRAVDKLFEMGASQRASDIHLEPQINGLFVRFRVDGMLHTVHCFPVAVRAAITSRIKVLAGMDITERRLPLDGQIRTKIKGREVDLRISTLPGKYGEKVVIRILDKSASALDLSNTGMDAVIQSRFEMLIDQPQGIILVTGPTGSGKTTTLYSVIQRLRSPLKNIITLEDPIEYELLSEQDDETGVTQVQVNPKIGLSFSAGLRASLRQDPDVIMVGEIRDKETAETAMKASMTGHLVFSTVHTNSSVETIGRLRDIGIDSWLISSTVSGIMAQRLVRILCNACKESYKPPLRVLETMFPYRQVDINTTLFRAKQCDECHGTGYRGRQGIFELLLMTREMRNLVQINASLEEVAKMAHMQGLVSLRQSGLEMVYSGQTTIEEVYHHTMAASEETICR